MKYIDAERLKAEIDNLESFSCISEVEDGFYSAISRINGIIDSLQQEFPTTDKSVKEFLATHPKVEVPEKYKTPDFVFKKQVQQEQPEVDLEKEFADFLEKENAYVNDDGMISYYNGSSFDHTYDIYPIARHFYELGFNARKED